MLFLDNLFFGVTSLLADMANFVSNLLFPPGRAYNARDSNSPASQVRRSGFSLAQDDLEHAISDLYYAHNNPEPILRLPGELADELQKLGERYGFKVHQESDIYLWNEDNMWFSADGSAAFQPARAAFYDQRTMIDPERDQYQRFTNALVGKNVPGAEEEGYHSLGSFHSQGVYQDMLDQAGNLVNKHKIPLFKTFSIIDGGNMLTGRRANGELYALVGRDAVLQTTVKYNSDRERLAAFIENTKPATYIPREIALLILESAGLVPPGLAHQARLDFAQSTLNKTGYVFYSNAFMMSEDAKKSLPELSPAQKVIIDNYHQSFTDHSMTPDNLDRLREDVYNLLITAHFYNPEIDLQLLESANLVPAGLDHQARLNFARAVRIKAQFVLEQNRLVMPENANGQMALSSDQKTMIENHYQPLFGGTLPADFYHLLLKDFNILKAAQQLPPFYSDALIEDKLSGWQPEPAAITRMTIMLTTAGYIRQSLTPEEARNEAIRFLAMTEITKDIMARELNVERRNLVIISQQEFHIDMDTRPLSEGRVLLNNHAESIKLVQSVLNTDTDLTEKNKEDLQKTLRDLEQLHKERQPVTALIKRQLQDAGLTVIDTPGVFSTGGRQVNYMNGIMGTSSLTKEMFYITNASSITALNHAFGNWIQKQQPGLNVHFVGSAQSQHNTNLNQAEELLNRGGGLDCVTLHHGPAGKRVPQSAASLVEAMSSMPERPPAIAPAMTHESSSDTLFRRTMGTQIVEMRYQT